jgi:Glyoxalase-like domain
MALRLVQIAVDARDDSAVGRFWAEALGWSVSSEEPGVTNLEPVGFAYPDPAAVCIDVVAVPEPKTVKNRVHIDLATPLRPIRRTWSRACRISARRPPTWARAMSHGPSWPTRRATSSTPSPRAEAEPVSDMTIEVIPPKTDHEVNLSYTTIMDAAEWQWSSTRHGTPIRQGGTRRPGVPITLSDCGWSAAIAREVFVLH